jgi:hypothetical protein
MSLKGTGSRDGYFLRFKHFIQYLLCVRFSVIGLRSPGSATHWLQGKCPNLGVTGGCRYFLHDHRQLPECIFRVQIAALRPLKWFKETILKISNTFLGAR